MADVIATSFGALNYSGLLFGKGRPETPFSTMIAGNRKVTDHVEFPVGVQYNIPTGVIPAISETASLTAPDSATVTRSQATNVTQIFMDAFYVSDAHRANMGTLAGLNVANQVANPINEVDFQGALAMQRIAQSIEKTFIQGTYNKAVSDATINKTRGISAAITTNVKAMSSAPLSIWDIADMLSTMSAAGADTTGLILWCDDIVKFQLSAEAYKNGFNVINQSRYINGLDVTRLETPAGAIDIKVGRYIPSGEAYLLNFNVIAPVEQLVPGKGNFYVEQLGKTGAGEKYMIFGQIGLDHGPEWMHGKFTGIKTSYDRPTGVDVNVVNASDFPSGT